MNKNSMKHTLFIVCQMFVFSAALAGVKPNCLFTDHMVLQKGVFVPVWATADDY
jgi:hypothetical protein